MMTVDLRSDIVTLPTDEMRRAIYEAELGDDVSGEDPTVNRLEEMAAERLGKEAAVLVASGTQGNLLAILAHCRSGDEIIAGANSHIFWNESAGAAALGGIQTHLVPNQKQGAMLPEDVEAAIRPGGDTHYPPTTLLCLENTQNQCNGGVVTTEEIEAVCRVAHDRDIPVHVDGARIFNASVYLETPVHELVREADDITFCLSKGLSAPIGSVLCGSREFIAEARRWRKMVGGGMRQAGIIAAGGIVALESMVERLAEDHSTARLMSQGLAQIPGIVHSPETVQTNIVFFELEEGLGSEAEFVRRLDEKGVKVGSSYGRIRMVTHRHITPAHVDVALAAVSQLMREMGR